MGFLAGRQAAKTLLVSNTSVLDFKGPFMPTEVQVGDA